MSARRELLKEPLVKAEVERIHFPQLCPVCGAPASSTNRVTVALDLNHPLRPSWEYGYSVQRLFAKWTQNTLRTLFVPVCEKHEYVGQDYCRLRVACILSDALAVTAACLAGLILGDSVWRGEPLPEWLPGILLLLGAAAASTYLAFRPRAIESAVRIVGVDPGLRHVFVLFRNAKYRDEFLRDNSMSSELVNWIARGKS